MKFLFIRLLFEAGAGEGAGGGATTTAATTTTTTEAEKTDANKALLEKFTAMEKEIAELKKVKPETEKETTTEKTETKTEEIPSWAKELVESNKKYAEMLATMSGEKVASTRRATLETELKAIEGLSKEHVEEVIDNFNGRTFKDDAEFETFKKGKVEKATKIAQDSSASSLTVFSAPGKSAGANGNKVSSAMTEYLKSKTPQPTKN